MSGAGPGIPAEAGCSSVSLGGEDLVGPTLAAAGNLRNKRVKDEFRWFSLRNTKRSTNSLKLGFGSLWVGLDGGCYAHKSNVIWIRIHSCCLKSSSRVELKEMCLYLHTSSASSAESLLFSIAR